MWIWQIHAFIEAPAVILEFETLVKSVEDPFQITQGFEVKQFSSLQSFSISNIKSIAKKQGVSFNAVLISIYGLGVGRYLTQNRDTSLDSLVVICAQPWPSRPNKFIGNRFNMMTTVVPLKVESSLEALREVQAQIIDFYSSRKFIIMKHISTILSLFPLRILGSILGARKGYRCLASPILCLDEYVLNGRQIRSVSPLSGLCGPMLGR